ncbi:peptidase S41 [Tateyamaria sp. syn59]|uniref:peptidase S41 n=1 Tax=Tateyamaria sp. syn59 TaxID=2576942 RepID=UPI0011BD9479|nr:peptidase S41 [Tateyamaria sp. syn59]
MDARADIEIIRDICLARDPSFGRVDTSELRGALNALQDQTEPDSFILQAMRCLALAGNGHTRIIPNPAIRIFPLRIVSVGSEFGALHDGTLYRLSAINGHPVNAVLDRLRPYLAGTAQRQRVIGPITLVWPAALAEIGVGNAGTVTYVLTDASGNTTNAHFGPDTLTDAAPLYPIYETGAFQPRTTPAHVIGLSNFGPDQSPPLEAQIDQATARIRSTPDAPIILDLRGNPGGDFLKTLPLLDALSTDWHGPVCVALINKFTFSAAIVHVALLRHRLGDRLHIVGEEMGDTTDFYAEGDTIDLPVSGTKLRYSTAWHDWKTGHPDSTTEPEIVAHMIGAGDLMPDTHIELTVRDLQTGRDPQLQKALQIARET